MSSNNLPWRFENVKSLFKKDKTTKISNYQFISLLRLLLKAIENIVHKQTAKLMMDNNIEHLGDRFLTFLNDKSLKDFDKGLYTSMTLIHL